MVGLLTIEQWVVFLVPTALVLAPVTALLMRWRYNATVRRLMRTGSGLQPASQTGRSRPTPSTSRQALKIDFRAPPGRLVPSRAMVRLGLGYFVAGASYALALTIVLLLFQDYGVSAKRTLILTLVFSTLAVFSGLYVAGVRFLLIILFSLSWLMVAMGLAALASRDGSTVWPLSYIVVLPFVIGVLLMNRKVGTIAPLLILPSMLIAAGFWIFSALLVNISLHLGMPAVAWFVAPLALLAALGGGWLCLAVMARQYRKGKVSELMLQNDVLWVLTSVNLAHPYIASHGWKALAMFIPFIVYRVVLGLFFRLSRPSSDPIRLLFLRVFGFQKRQGELHRVMLNAWRQQGPVALIGAPDSALDTLDPPELFAFVTGRLKTLFIPDAAAVRSELDRPQVRASDGLYQVDDFYCFEDTWQPSVQTLIESSQRVVMDLRGFNAQNMGCVFEIEQLLQRCELAQLVFLADSATDQAFLSQTLASAWGRQDRVRGDMSASLTVWMIDGAGALRGLTHQLGSQPDP